MLVLAASMAAQTVAIHDIMTNLPNSPLVGQTVTVSGVVVGVMSSGSFYISAPDSERDSDAATAEGIQIYAAAGLNPACGIVGNAVTVTGTVTNGTAVNGAHTPGTGIAPSSCTVNGTGAVDSTVALKSASSYAQDLPFTGMPVSNTVYHAVSPTSGTTDAATGIVSSTGQFWVTISVPKNGHVFKSAGLQADNFYPPPPAPPQGSSPGIPTWDGNPERLFVDTTTFGGAPVDIGAGQTLTCSPGAGLTVGATSGIGIIDYSLGYNRLLIFKTTTCTVSGSIAPSIASPADSQHFHVGTINLNNFHGASSPAYATRLAKAALAIVDVFGKPEIVSVQEVEDVTTLQAIGDAASARAGGGTSYKAYWSPPNDATNLGLGFLVNTQAVNVSQVYAINAGSSFQKLDGSTVPLWERPPFVLEAGLLRAGLNYQVEVVNIETTGREGIDDPVNGPNVWQRRGQQAEELSVFANAEQNRGQNLLIAGEYNAYSFSDGFADIVSVIAGTNPPAQGTVAQYEPTVTSPQMYNFVKSITVQNSVYNVIEDGNARSIEHILCSETQNSSASGSIYSYIAFVTQPHWTTDFPAVFANDPTTPAGLTPRDGFVGAFLIPPVPTTASFTPASVDFGSVYRGATSTPHALTFTNTSTFPSNVVVSNVAITGANASDFTVSSNCTTVTQSADCAVTVVFAPTGAGVRTATVTVSSDSGTNPTLRATLTGTGLDTTATLSPAKVSFPDTAAGSTSATQLFTWTNTSPLPLSITSVAVSGDYSVVPVTCVGVIAAGASCSVSVAFTPSAIGVRAGTLTVQSTSTADPQLTAALTGIGKANIVATPSALEFGVVDVGFASNSAAVTINNYSQHSIALLSSAISGDFAYISQCGATLGASSQCVLLVTFKPSATGPRTGTLTINTSDPVSPTLAVALTGSGGDFQVAVAPGSGTVIAGMQINFTATFTPVGGYSGTVKPTCNVPATAGGSQCNIAASLPLSSTTTRSVSVNTTSQFTVIGYEGAGNGWLALIAGLSGVLLFAGNWRVRGSKISLLIMLLAVLSAANLGCAGRLPDRNADPTNPGDYTYTVTATDGMLTHTASFQITVKTKN